MYDINMTEQLEGREITRLEYVCQVKAKLAACGAVMTRIPTTDCCVLVQWNASRHDQFTLDTSINHPALLLIILGRQTLCICLQSEKLLTNFSKISMILTSCFSH